MDFVFDRLADGRSLKCLAVVDDATQVADALSPERAISGLYVTRVLEELKGERGKPKSPLGTGQACCDTSSSRSARAYDLVCPLQLFSKELCPPVPERSSYFLRSPTGRSSRRTGVDG